MKIQNINSIETYISQRISEKEQANVTNNIGFNENACEVIISKEGLESYKKGLNKELLSKSIIDITGTIESDFYSRFKQMNTQIVKDNKSCSTNNLCENCFQTYSIMYDEIKQGYADGTRERWILDSTAEEGFRKVTEEEELAALDKAFDFYSQVVDGYVNRGMKADQIIQKAVNKLQEDIERQLHTNKLNSQVKEEINKGEKLDIYSNLINLTNVWKDKYTINVNTFSLYNQIIKDNLVNYTVK